MLKQNMKKNKYIVSVYENIFKSYNFTVVYNFIGISKKEILQIKKDCKEFDVCVKVIKPGLLKKLHMLPLHRDFFRTLEGSCLLLYTNNENIFNKKFKLEVHNKLIPLGGVYENKVIYNSSLKKLFKTDLKTNRLNTVSNLVLPYLQLRYLLKRKADIA